MLKFPEENSPDSHEFLLQTAGTIAILIFSFVSFIIFWIKSQKIKICYPIFL